MTEAYLEGTQVQGFRDLSSGVVKAHLGPSASLTRNLYGAHAYAFNPAPQHLKDGLLASKTARQSLRFAFCLFQLKSRVHPMQETLTSDVEVAAPAR